MRARFNIEREHNKALIEEITNDNIAGKYLCNFHSQIELYFVDEGQIETLINHHRRLLAKDQMAIALSYDAHMFRSIGTSRSRILIIPPEYCKEFTQALQNKQVTYPFLCDEPVVRQLKQYVDAIQSDCSNDVKLRGYINVILGTILEHSFLEPSENPLDIALSSRLLAYLHAHFREEISLHTLSAVFGYSPSYISRYFKSCFGTGISQYLNILRLRNALLLMQGGQNTNTYCAFESGFSSLRTFYRVFQQEFGCSPRDYTPLLKEQP